MGHENRSFDLEVCFFPNRRKAVREPALKANADFTVSYLVQTAGSSVFEESTIDNAKFGINGTLGDSAEAMDDVDQPRYRLYVVKPELAYVTHRLRKRLEACVEVIVLQFKEDPDPSAVLPGRKDKKLKFKLNMDKVIQEKEGKAKEVKIFDGLVRVAIKQKEEPPPDEADAQEVN